MGGLQSGLRDGRVSHELAICVLGNIANQPDGEVNDFSGIERRECAEVFHRARGG